MLDLFYVWFVLFLLVNLEECILCILIFKLALEKLGNE